MPPPPQRTGFNYTAEAPAAKLARIVWSAYCDA